MRLNKCCCTQARVVSVRVVRFFCNEAQRRALSLSFSLARSTVNTLFPVRPTPPRFPTDDEFLSLKAERSASASSQLAARRRAPHSLCRHGRLPNSSPLQYSPNFINPSRLLLMLHRFNPRDILRAPPQSDYSDDDDSINLIPVKNKQLVW